MCVRVIGKAQSAVATATAEVVQGSILAFAGTLPVGIRVASIPATELAAAAFVVGGVFAVSI